MILERGFADALRAAQESAAAKPMPSGPLKNQPRQRSRLAQYCLSTCQTMSASRDKLLGAIEGVGATPLGNSELLNKLSADMSSDRVRDTVKDAAATGRSLELETVGRLTSTLTGKLKALQAELTKHAPPAGPGPAPPQTSAHPAMLAAAAAAAVTSAISALEGAATAPRGSGRTTASTVAGGLLKPLMDTRAAMELAKSAIPPAADKMSAHAKSNSALIICGALTAGFAYISTTGQVAAPLPLPDRPVHRLVYTFNGLLADRLIALAGKSPVAKGDFPDMRDWEAAASAVGLQPRASQYALFAQAGSLGSPSNFVTHILGPQPPPAATTYFNRPGQWSKYENRVLVAVIAAFPSWFFVSRPLGTTPLKSLAPHGAKSVLVENALLKPRLYSPAFGGGEPTGADIGKALACATASMGVMDAGPQKCDYTGPGAPTGANIKQTAALGGFTATVKFTPTNAKCELGGEVGRGGARAGAGAGAAFVQGSSALGRMEPLNEPFMPIDTVTFTATSAKREALSARSAAFRASSALKVKLDVARGLAAPTPSPNRKQQENVWITNNAHAIRAVASALASKWAGDAVQGLQAFTSDGEGLVYANPDGVAFASQAIYSALHSALNGKIRPSVSFLPTSPKGAAVDAVSTLYFAPVAGSPLINTAGNKAWQRCSTDNPVMNFKPNALTSALVAAYAASVSIDQYHDYHDPSRVAEALLPPTMRGGVTTTRYQAAAAAEAAERQAHMEELADYIAAHALFAALPSLAHIVQNTATGGVRTLPSDATSSAPQGLDQCLRAAADATLDTIVEDMVAQGRLDDAGLRAQLAAIVNEAAARAANLNVFGSIKNGGEAVTTTMERAVEALQDRADAMEITPTPSPVSSEGSATATSTHPAMEVTSGTPTPTRAKRRAASQSASTPPDSKQLKLADATPQLAMPASSAAVRALPSDSSPKGSPESGLGSGSSRGSSAEPWSQDSGLGGGSSRGSPAEPQSQGGRGTRRTRTKRTRTKQKLTKRKRTKRTLTKQKLAKRKRKPARTRRRK